MKLRLTLFIYYFFFCVLLPAQLTINIIQVPSNTIPDAQLYLAGNFNNWNPASNNYKFKNIEGIYTFTFTPNIQNLEFKITRGSWSTVEGSNTGTFIPNRTYKYTNKDTINLTIKGWEDIKPTISTATENVSILTDSFYMKALNRYRRIWIYLPPDYKTSNKYYNIAYMHDGQNLFDKKTAFSDEWKVDETLDEIFKQGYETPIVIGIDNGGGKRIDEYTPWKNAQYGGGEGDKYLEFLVDELKPYIDSKYRTKRFAENTALIGSSMGGLISMYGGIKYPNHFTKIGALSSAFWVSPEVYNYVENNIMPGLKIYMIAGGKEGGTQVEDMYMMEDIIIGKQYKKGIDIISTDHPTEGHNELYWSKEFKNIILWLFADQVKSEDFSLQTSKIKVDQDSIYYEGIDKEECQVLVYDIYGKKLIQGKEKIRKELLPRTDYYLINVINNAYQIIDKRLLYIIK